VLCEKYTKLFYQETYKVLQETQNSVMANQKEKEKKAREETIELDEYTAAGNISDRK